MRPNLLEAFVQAHQEAWRAMAFEATAAARHATNALAEIDRRIDNLVNILADGAPSRALRAKLAAMEAQREMLRQAQAQGDETVPDLPSDLGEAYQEAINHLADALQDRDNPKALELARDLIDRIVITPPDDDDDPLIIDLEGNFAALLTLAAGNAMPISPGTPTYRLVNNLTSSIKEQPGAWGGAPQIRSHSPLQTCPAKPAPNGTCRASWPCLNLFFSRHIVHKSACAILPGRRGALP